MKAEVLNDRLRIFPEGIEPSRLVRRCMFLAYEAVENKALAIQPVPRTESEIWEKAETNGTGFVFGKKLSLKIVWTANYIEVSTAKLNAYYQPWSKRYPTYAELISAAIESLEKGE